jgi:hypothetical protein
MNRGLAKAKANAQKAGIDPSTLRISEAKGKRFAITVDGKTINFGLFPFSGQGTFIDHGDTKLRDSWYARHSKIKLKDGSQAINTKTSPDYYSARILWAK